MIEEQVARRPQMTNDLANGVMRLEWTHTAADDHLRSLLTLKASINVWGAIMRISSP